MIILVAAAFQACKNRGNVVHTDDDSISSADSLNAVKIPDKDSVLTDKADLLFVDSVAKGCITESALAKIALKNGHNKLVKNFGGMMSKDLAKADKRIQALSKKKGVVLRAGTDEKGLSVIAELNKKSGSDFDRAYINYIAADHRAYIGLFENAAQNSGDRDIKAFAKKSLGVLNAHLDAIKTIQDNINR
jgi:putative membrane protein